MANIITLKSFPFDSMEVLNEQSGQLEADRLYEAEIFRKYFAKFLSNGVYFGHYKNYGENSMKVTADGGLNIRVAAGAGIIEGADYENENEQVYTLERPTTGNRIDRVIVKLDKTLATRETQLYIKQGNGTTPAVLQRNDNIYEICLAEVTVKSTTNISETDIKDMRLDKNLCGIVTSLISVDGKELRQRFEEYIDSIIDNLVRKDQDIITNVNIVGKTIKDVNNKTLSTNDFTNAYKSKLDELVNTVINNTLTSTATNQALAAAMGKKLQDEKQKKITYGTAAPTRRK